MFLPCAPNPTTGFFFYVPKSKIIEVEMSAEDAATLIMSCGVVQPGSDPQKKIAALAEMANAARVANAARAAAGAGEGGVRLGGRWRNAASHACVIAGAHVEAIHPGLTRIRKNWIASLRLAMTL